MFGHFQGDDFNGLPSEYPWLASGCVWVPFTGLYALIPFFEVVPSNERVHMQLLLLWPIQTIGNLKEIRLTARDKGESCCLAKRSPQAMGLRICFQGEDVIIQGLKWTVFSITRWRYCFCLQPFRSFPSFKFKARGIVFVQQRGSLSSIL